MTVTAQQLEKALTVLDQVVASVNIGRGSMTASYGHRTSTGSQEHAPLPVDVDLIDRKIAAHRFCRRTTLRHDTQEPLMCEASRQLAKARYALDQMRGTGRYDIPELLDHLTLEHHCEHDKDNG